MRKTCLLLPTLLLSLLLSLLLTLTHITPINAQTNPNREIALESVLNHVKSTATHDDWAIFALARAERVTINDPLVQEWLSGITAVLSEIDAILTANPGFSINAPPSAGTFPASLRRWTDFQRVTLTLGALGLDAANFQNHDITEPYSTFIPSTERHALNRTILADMFALITLETTQNNSETDLFLTHILNAQRADGTWSLNPAQPTSAFDLDITAIGVQALAPFYRRGNPRAVAAAENALGWLRTQDFPDPESTAQMIIALTALGSAYASEVGRYVDRLLEWFDPTNGGFRRFTHTSAVDPISTVQAANALVAYWRFINGMSHLYEISGISADVSTLQTTANRPQGMNQNVSRVNIFHPDRTFNDIRNHENQSAIEALAARGIISGRSETRFAPDESVTRAEFAAIITRGLGLPERNADTFADVPRAAWFAPAVGTAYYFGIVSGVAPTRFNPTGTLTRQEAAVIITRAARLCGIDTNLTDWEILNTLAMFGDYRTAADWAWSALAFCFREGILDDYEFYITPTAIISRGEIAEMLYRLLFRANLL